MFKKIFLLSTFLLIFIIIPPNIAYCAAENSVCLKVIINEKKLNLRESPIILSNHAYIPLREVCQNLNINLRWSDYSRCAIIFLNKNKSVKINIKNGYIFIDGIRKEQAAVINGSILLSARLLGELFGFSVEWNKDFRTVSLSHKKSILDEKKIARILSEPLPYSDEDIYWLSRIVNAEACGETYEAKLAVANVILNRQKNPHYPDTIKNVIFDSNCGVQFTPTANGAIYNVPGAESIAAAIDALSGVNNAKNILFFMNPKKSTSFWIIENRSYGFTLGNHDFYY